MGGKRTVIVLVLLLCFVFITEAQQDTIYYRIHFSDKNNNGYSINTPSAFLSERALARREKMEIDVVFSDLPITQTYVDQIVSFSTVEYVTHSNWMNTLVVTSYDTIQVQAIQSLPFVAQTDKLHYPIQNIESDRKLLVDYAKILDIDVAYHYPYGKTYNQLHLHHIDYLHDLGFQGQEMQIAVIDAGFEKANELSGLKHLFDGGQILSIKDFVDLDGSVYEDHFHGSAVLSVMGGYLPGEFVGTAPKAKYHLLRSEDAGSEYIVEEDFWVRAAEYSDSIGVDIINTSLGYSTFDDSTQNHTYADLDGNTTIIARGSDMAASKGILLVTSAGNLGNSSWGYISTPADADSILTVGAVDSLGARGDFSSYGYSADGDIKPNVMSVGWNCYIIAPWDNTIIRGNGTSFSAPMMSGMAACLWQALPELNNMELKNLIEENANNYNSPDSLYGYGIPDFYKSYQVVTGLHYQRSETLVVEELFPNPSYDSEDLLLRVSSDKEQLVLITLSNNLGQTILLKETLLLEGKNEIHFSVDNDLSSGMYQITVTNEDEKHSLSWIKS